jgi:putative ABC transport system substrate-binding protein
MMPACTRLARRRFLQGSLTLASFGVLAGCKMALPGAQPGPRTSRIGWLAFGTPAGMSDIFNALRQGLADHGYVDGQNLLLEARWAEDQARRLPELAQELVRLNPEVIVTQAIPATQAVKAATSTIPIVGVSVSDPVGLGLAVSLARPGGNYTGLTLTTPEQAGKRLELLKAAAPSISRVAFFYFPGNQRDLADLAAAQAAAPALELTLLPLPVNAPEDFAPAFAQAVDQRADGASFHAGTLSSCCVPQIVGFTVQHRLPAMHAGRSQGPDFGGLMSYAASSTDNYRRAATYVDKILKGAKPGEIPIENPTRFEFVINLTTAQTLGLNISPELLAQATELLQ